ncbi:MAG: hypothetical protein Q4B99_04320 [Clostridia bacterium]|nr:hypothetical protein [Clostridia bacterium]
MKKFTALIVAALVALTLFASSCGTVTPKIAVLIPSAEAGATEAQVEAARLAMEGMSGLYGIEYIFRTFDTAEEQMRLIDSALGWNAAAIVLWCVDPAAEGMYDAAKSILDDEVPLIFCGPVITGLNATAYFAFDSTAEDAASALGSILAGDAGASVLAVGDTLHKGDYSVAVADSTREGARAAVAAWLDAGDSDTTSALTSIVIESDEMALGVLDALDDYRGRLNIDCIVSAGGGAYLLASGSYSADVMASVAYGQDEIAAAVQLACCIALGDDSFSGIGITSNMTYASVPVFVR